MPLSMRPAITTLFTSPRSTPMATHAAITAISNLTYKLDIEYWVRHIPNSNQPASLLLKRKRAPLTEMSGNLTTNAPSTPEAKRARTDNRATANVQPVDDSTPRPTGSYFHTGDIAFRLPSDGAHPPKSQGSAASSTHQDSAQSETDASNKTDNSNKRKRSESPTKNMASLRLVKRPIKMEAIGEPSDLPESFQSMAKVITRFGLGKGIISAESQVCDRKPPDEPPSVLILFQTERTLSHSPLDHG